MINGETIRIVVVRRSSRRLLSPGALADER